jgi:K(+)-stimulated pyrophosphate-energized sodium pump
MNADALKTLTGWIPWLGVAGMIVAVITYFDVMRMPAGSELMRKLSDKVHHGAFVFLRREYQIIAVFIVIVFVALAVLLSIWTAVAFLSGALCSMTAGLLGMEASTRSNARTAQAAMDGGISRALSVAFRGGSVMGISVAALGIVGLGFFYFFTQNPLIINGFAMGASSIALFARVGGGI